MNVRLALLWAAVGLATIAVACGSSDDDAEPTAEEKAYLESVSQAFDLFAANIEEFNKIFGQAWPLPSLLFMALEEAGAGKALDSTLVELEKMDPPKRFAADHALLVAGVREAIIADQQVGQAVVDVDLLGFSLANISLGQKQVKMRLSLSKPVCNAAEPTEGDKHDSICERPQPDDGKYGKELFALMSELQIEVTPRASVEIPPFVFDLAEDLLAAISTELVRALEEAVAAAGAMDPPERFEGDHQRVVEYLEEQLQAANSATVEDLTERPPEGPPPGIVTYCEAKEAFTKEYARLVTVHFGDDDDICNPEREQPP
ncbi:MAG: hypothetical protein BZY88_13255 [SAR202 cluster bacterium Io17-Chloro-G9]|nr:MAG: hypothetical protein BZY88_13255 [SAR202 cluster bacterium Io17-Chloro-G9]